MSADASAGSPVNAWQDDWERQADVCSLWSLLTVIATNAIQTNIPLRGRRLTHNTQTLDVEQPPQPGKKVTSKASKAQRRAQQAEFNRQLWAEA